MISVPQHERCKFQVFGDLSKNTSKILGKIVRATCKPFGKMKEIVREVKIYQNICICMHRTKGKDFKFLEVFCKNTSNALENDARAICKAFEKNERHC